MKPLKLQGLPDYDVLDVKRHEVVLGSAGRLLHRLQQDDVDSGSWNLRESVWPALGARAARDAKYLQLEPRLMLIPLSRIGARGGFSGSDILLGYFFDVEGRIYSSLPLVIKLSERTGGERKLIEEERLAQSIRPYVGYNKDSFAVPIDLDTTQPGFDVLWSPFALSELVEFGPRPGLRNNDMRDLLDLKDKEAAEIQQSFANLRTLIDAVYDTLNPLHTRAGLWDRYRRGLAAEYASYLRKFEDSWGTEWIEQWGRSEYVEELGNRYANPIWVIGQLQLSRDVDLICGAVHGDLHPGNVLYSDPHTPSIIDFGWADADSHLAKDFVLLECNLRFIYMPGELPLGCVQKFSRWIGMSQTCEGLENLWCVEAQETIASIREYFKKLANQKDNGDQNGKDGEHVDFDIEYIVPLFLVSFGLLRYVGDYKNQIAARQTVLNLADYIHSTVLQKLHIPKP